MPANCCTKVNPANCYERSNVWHEGKKPAREQIVNLLRQTNAVVANGKTTVRSRNQAVTSEQTYYRG